MLDYFEVKLENGEEVLYLHLSYDYEFGKEFFSNIKEMKLTKQIQKWIKENKIVFHGKKVLVVASGIVVASFLLHNPVQHDSSDFLNPVSSITTHLLAQTPNLSSDMTDSDVIEESIQESNSTLLEQEKVEMSESDSQSVETPSEEVVSPPVQSQENVQQNTPQENVQPENSQQESVPQETPNVETTIENPITIYRNGTPVVLEFETYIAGVVAAEMPASFSMEALRAQAILARTYALKLTQDGRILTDSTSTQVYYDTSQLQSMWKGDYEYYWNKVKEACQSTKGMTLRYNGQYIDAVYHSTSNGKTEAARNVWGYEIPYLQSVDSHWDYNTTFYTKTEYKDLNQLLSIFGVTDLQASDIEILRRNESGRVSEVRIQNQTYQGVDLRSLLNLQSADFDLWVEDGNLVITTRGWGHGVGMSQYGANGMAKEGYTYAQILQHYYPGTTIGN